jgi:hypothetical protein
MVIINPHSVRICIFETTYLVIHQTKPIQYCENLWCTKATDDVFKIYNKWREMIPQTSQLKVKNWKQTKIKRTLGTI